MFSTNVFMLKFSSEGAVVNEDQRAERSAAEWGTARWFPRITTHLSTPATYPGPLMSCLLTFSNPALYCVAIAGIIQRREEDLKRELQEEIEKKEVDLKKVMKRVLEEEMGKRVEDLKIKMKEEMRKLQVNMAGPKYG